MGKATKADLGTTVGSADGIIVAEEQGQFQIAFSFSSNLVNKIKQVPGAEFNEAMNCWVAPATSGKELIEVVADMRDFVRSNGVQVKDLPGGGKSVLFDYNKDLAREIAGVEGAKFDNAKFIWTVAADSKALTPKNPGESSYFEYAINSMRGIAQEVAKANEEIMTLATESAKAQGVKPGIHFPKADHSYSGPVLNVNGHFAAQLSGRDDEKGVGYITIHRLSDMPKGKDLLKGQDLRIDYDEQRRVSVRTQEVFREQQADRETLTKMALGLADGASVRNAAQKEGTKHNGAVIEKTNHFVLQHLGRNQFVIHNLDNLSNRDFAKGDNLDIAYKKDGYANVKNLSKQKEVATGVSR